MPYYDEAYPCEKSICIRSCPRLLTQNLFNNLNVEDSYWILKKVMFMVFNATSVISWRLDLLVEKTTNQSQVTDKLYHIMLYRVHRTWAGFEPTVVTGTDCIGSYKSKYHMIMTTMAPEYWRKSTNHHQLVYKVEYVGLCLVVHGQLRFHQKLLINYYLLINHLYCLESENVYSIKFILQIF